MDLLGGIARRVRNDTPVPYVSPGFGFGAGRLGSLFNRASQASQMAAYGSVGTLFAVVSAITDACAAQGWWMERIRADTRMYGPSRTTTTPLLRHPALDLWEKPNNFMSRHDLVELSTQHLKLTGEAAWLIASDPRFPTLPLELWPVRPDWITPVPDPKKFLAGYIFHGPSGEQVPLETSQVIHIKLPNPLDPWRGLGPVQSMLADLDSVRYSAEWNRRFFLNDAAPGGVIELEDNLGDTEFERLKDRWYDQHRGVNNAHRVAFLERAKWVQMMFSPRDMQFTELRHVASDAIREAFRVHKATVGQSDDVNRANADAADYQLAKWNVNPTLSRFQGALNTRLLPLYGTPVVTQLCYESAVQEDQAAGDAHLTAATSSFATLVAQGVDPDSAAEVCGLPPLVMVDRAPMLAPAPPLPEEIPA